MIEMYVYTLIGVLILLVVLIYILRFIEYRESVKKEREFERIGANKAILSRPVDDDEYYGYNSTSTSTTRQGG